MFCIQKIEKNKTKDLACFTNLKWKRLRDSIVSIKTDQAKQSGAKLINSQDMADDEEVETLATLCLWQGTERGVIFFTFNNLMYHLIARCSETAAFWKNDLSVVKKITIGKKSYPQIRFDTHQNQDNSRTCGLCTQKQIPLGFILCIWYALCH